MSTESDKRQLTLDDPVDPEVLANLERIQTFEAQTAQNLLDLEKQKVRLLRASTELDRERQRIFDSILLARGLPPNTPAEINAKTGRIQVLNTPSETEAPKPVA